MRYWEEYYNLNQEKFMAAPVWVRLFSLPVDFSNPEILEGIGNYIARFVKVVDSTCRGKYTSYARFFIYMNITKPLPEFIELEYQGEVWQQPLDYEHISFYCQKCHEYGHLFREFPLNRNWKTPKNPTSHMKIMRVLKRFQIERGIQNQPRPIHKQWTSVNNNHYEVLMEEGENTRESCQ